MIMALLTINIVRIWIFSVYLLPGPGSESESGDYIKWGLSGLGLIDS